MNDFIERDNMTDPARLPCSLKPEFSCQAAYEMCLSTRAFPFQSLLSPESVKCVRYGRDFNHYFFIQNCSIVMFFFPVVWQAHETTMHYNQIWISTFTSTNPLENIE